MDLERIKSAIQTLEKERLERESKLKNAIDVHLQLMKDKKKGLSCYEKL